MDDEMQQLKQRLDAAERQMAQMRRTLRFVCIFALIAVAGVATVALPLRGDAQVQALKKKKKKAKKLIAKTPFEVKDANGNTVFDVVATDNGGKLRIYNAAGQVVVEVGSDSTGNGIVAVDPATGWEARLGITSEGPDATFRDGDTQAEIGVELGFGSFVGVEKGNAAAHLSCGATPGAELGLVDEFGVVSAFMTARGAENPIGGELQLRLPGGGFFIVPPP